MRKIRSLGAMLHSLLVDWFYSPRTIISVVFLTALAYMNARSYVNMLDMAQLYAYPGESIYYFLSSGFGNVTLTSALFLVMMAEVPRRIAFQNVLLIRSSRKKWLSAQLLFCCFAAVLMILFLLLFSMLFSAGGISNGTGWSDLERIAQDPDALYMPQLTSEYIRRLTPVQASFSAFFVLFFFWFTMTLIVLLCTLLGKPSAGIILYISLLVLHVTLLWEALPVWMRYMPANFATLQHVGSSFPEQELQVLPIVFGVYIALDIVLILCMSIKVKKMELFFEERR